MDCFKGNNRGIIDKVLNQYEQMVNMNLETTLNSQNWKRSLKQWLPSVSPVAAIHITKLYCYRMVWKP